MKSFNLKGEWLVPHAPNDEQAPGRTIYPEPLLMAEPEWDRRSQPVRGTGAHGDERKQREFAVRREGDVEDEEMRAAREWLAHVEAGRTGG